jgi:hypothetical protein
MARSVRLVSALLLLAMISDRAIAAACGFACLSAGPDSRDVQPRPAERAAHACHESAPSTDTTQVAARARDGCHGDRQAPFVLAATSIREAVESSDLTRSTRFELAITGASVHGLLEHTPPDLQRTPIVPLRI